MMKLRIEQRQDEPPDIFAMRAFAMAMPLMNAHELHAAASWINDITVARIKKDALAEKEKAKP